MKLSILISSALIPLATAFLIIPDVKTNIETPGSTHSMLKDAESQELSIQASIQDAKWPVDQRWQIVTNTNPPYAVTAYNSQRVEGPIKVYPLDMNAYSQIFYAQPFFVDGKPVVDIITAAHMWLGVSKDESRVTVDYPDDWEMEAVDNEEDLDIYRFRPLEDIDKYWTVNPEEGGIITLEEKDSGGCQEWLVRRV